DRRNGGGGEALQGVGAGDAVGDEGVAAALGLDAGNVVRQGHVVEDRAREGSGVVHDPLPGVGGEVAVVADDRVGDVQRAVGEGGREVDARHREAVDRAVLDLDGATGEDGDAGEAGAQALDVEAAQ